MSDSPLDSPAQYLKGAGPRRAAALEKLNLSTVRDVLFNLPRDVLDLTDVKSASELTGKSIETVRGVVVDRDARLISRGRSMTTILLDSGGEYVRGVWFNQQWILKKYSDGEPLLFSAKAKKRDGRWEMSHPRVQQLGEDEAAESLELRGERSEKELLDPQPSPLTSHPSPLTTPHGEVLPRYSLVEGLTMEALRTISRDAVDRYAGEVSDPLPATFRDEAALPELSDAMRALHRPATVAAFEEAKRRILFDDLFEFQIGMALRRRAWTATDGSPRIETPAKVDARIRRLFPFEFTPGQNQAIREITSDLATPRAMHRLLQADVGAGKTVVAVYAMLSAIAAGYQAVVMAPTEVLANQHWKTIDAALSRSRVKRRLLTGSLTPAERKRTLADIAEGKVDLVVGTQALIQEDVTLPRLGLAVVDEQHKFGVAQRSRFARANEVESLETIGEQAVKDADLSSLNSQPEASAPHLLVMTATPIPRSLCLTQFGDLDVTRITDLPPGRQRVVTSRVDGKLGRKKAWEFIRQRLAEGRQAYVVCPRIEPNGEDLDAAVPGSVETVFERLRMNELSEGWGEAGDRTNKDSPAPEVALLHGRMSSDEKDAVMTAFRRGDIRVLVTTTVIEVGVDVPNATLMVIYQANRFGLSQLHQLRGRIGRGRHQGYCFLLPDGETDDATKRLAVMEQTSDGFKIAEADFEIRGPGDVLGTRQSGGMPLRVAHPGRDLELLIEARQHAFNTVDSGAIDAGAWDEVRQVVLSRFAETLDLPQGG
ncbi:ATP-dependent DNA helicase RecG [Stratiformator vulcanicus]|uniref:Probable DNA 3'-5' helicase RecG n=1 Tax=Stratiformator vulcanicus TaxID=2527980 RepID=A0A517R7U5_9PLAN|nr:ATP-dependent DNA helicase RecG [Stratiformator vulcanicus]QDT39901.1 ATP-dependent DNA helicase RecG [Stratiformator vulcanicus]